MTLARTHGHIEIEAPASARTTNPYGTEVKVAMNSNYLAISWRKAKLLSRQKLKSNLIWEATFRTCIHTYSQPSPSPAYPCTQIWFWTGQKNLSKSGRESRAKEIRISIKSFLIRATILIPFLNLSVLFSPFLLSPLPFFPLAFL